MSNEKASNSEQRLEELQEGTLAAPKDSELCLTLGEAFLRVNRVDEAAASYQRAVELDPRSDLKALYWEWLGLVREMEGRLEEALEAYFQWLDADPVAISPLDRLGSLLVVLGRWTDLKLLGPQFERRIEVSGHPRGRESLALYTFVTEQFGQTDAEEAKEVTLQALEADPDSPSMRFLLGLLTYREGSIELARGEFERVLALDHDNLWQEPRFALDWNSSKARVMVAKLARQQGDMATALRLLVEADDLERSDSEGLIEVAELLLEDDRYDDFLHVMRDIPEGPSRLNRLQAESLLGKGRFREAGDILQTEAILFREEPGHLHQDPEAQLALELRELWKRFEDGEPVLEHLSSLRKLAPDRVLADPVGASLVLLQRLQSGALGERGADKEVTELCARHPLSPEVWETVRRVQARAGDAHTSQLASLMKSKLKHGSQPGPTGHYVMKDSGSTEVLVGVLTDVGPLVLRLEADIGKGGRDQVFGWGREFLMPGLELAKGVLENLSEQRSHQRELGASLTFLPESFRVMVTPVSVPAESSRSFLEEGELGSIPLAFLVAFLSVIQNPPRSKILVMGRLGLRGQVDGVPELEETLMAVHHSGASWNELLLAEAGGYRLLRSPSWLWHDRVVNLVRSARQLVAQVSTEEGCP